MVDPIDSNAFFTSDLFSALPRNSVSIDAINKPLNCCSTIMIVDHTDIVISNQCLIYTRFSIN